MKDYILSLLEGEETEENPCTSLAGCQGTTPVGVQEEAGIEWPAAHKDSQKMADLAIKSSDIIGIENVRVPFDACVEPEALGAEISWGSKQNDPYISGYPFSDNPEDVKVPEDLLELGRIPTVIEAIKEVQSNLDKDKPVSTTVIGPLTLVGELIGTEDLLRKTITEKDLIKELVERVTEIPQKLISRYYEAGADVVQVIEPSSSADMIPPNIFTEILQPHLSKISSEVDRPLILHICGNIEPILPAIMELDFDGVSLGSGININKAKKEASEGTKLLGNISPDTLSKGSPSKVKKEVSNAINQGIDFIEPDDGFVPVATLENVETMVKATKEKR
ncbi:MAG: Methylcobalamin:coenzyme M methyltransferase MtbA [Candidatus Methanohalarchaeum thermophilum]|uniref:Methylcobalamin:coenzyme M methyltransferase MtbA n=1 Tax=Methanohalarchaeum thermophilum TaxID=1903181 RepID=A0A1Q6DXN6_METT1|nr:MAG: Methylcobalamin:coenzyme M methyltransferase MtbA [Candidatus Methanohalarchaeum thermophilum]